MSHRLQMHGYAGLSFWRFRSCSLALRISRPCSQRGADVWELTRGIAAISDFINHACFSASGYLAHRGRIMFLVTRYGPIRKTTMNFCHSADRPAGSIIKLACFLLFSARLSTSVITPSPTTNFRYRYSQRLAEAFRPPNPSSRSTTDQQSPPTRPSTTTRVSSS